jgi:hypothetical protein
MMPAGEWQNDKLGSGGLLVGMDLSGAGGYFRWTNSGWSDILELGQEFGWVPLGTGPPRGVLKADFQNGPYHGNGGQRFYARDARALADAQEREIVAISESKHLKRSRSARATDYLEAQLRGEDAPEQGRVVRDFGTEDVAYIREFIEFCRAGSFRIY